MKATKKEIRSSNGYRLMLEPEHPRSIKAGNWKGYVYEHIVIVESDLGRSLSQDEVVHHLDRNRANNRSENLIVLSRSQHVKLHKWLEAGAPGMKVPGMQGMNSGKAKVAEPRYCLACGSTLQGKQKKFCSRECASHSRRQSDRPSAVQLAKDIQSLSWLAIGRKYGVSDNAARKWARGYQLLC